jgi:hypothetical protein
VGLALDHPESETSTARSAHSASRPLVTGLIMILLQADRDAIPSMALVQQYADWTRQYCDGLLHGDFAVLGELRRRPRARIEATDQFPR